MLVQRFLTVLGVMLMLLGVFGLSYTWHIDHRSAETLSEYAATEFNVSRDGEGYVEGAVFILWDYRFDDAELVKKAVLNAETIRVQFFYDNGQTIDLPLSSKDLALWKRKIRW